MRALAAAAGGWARAFSAEIEALANATTAELDPDQVAKALSLVAWHDDIERVPLP